MNSSVTPLSTPVQANRPFKYANREAARVLDMIRGSYLFDDDAKRIIQDSESQRASFSRQGAAWKAWSILRDTHAHANQLLGPQSRRDGASRARGLVGAQYARRCASIS